MYIAERSWYNCVHRILCKYFRSFKVATVFPPKCITTTLNYEMSGLFSFRIRFSTLHEINQERVKKLKLRLRFKRNTYITERKYRTNPKKNVKLTGWGKGWIPWLSHFCFRFVCFHFLFSLLLFCFFFLSPWNFAILYTLKTLTNVKATHHRLNYTDETVMVK